MRCTGCGSAASVSLGVRRMMKARCTIGASVAILALGLGAGGYTWLNTNHFGKVVRAGCYMGILPSPEYVPVPRGYPLGWTPSTADVSRAEEKLRTYIADHRTEVGPKVSDELSQYRSPATLFCSVPRPEAGGTGLSGGYPVPRPFPGSTCPL